MGENAEEQPLSPAISHSDEAESEWGATIHSLAAKLADHPGFMWAETGFEVLHADWPAYPLGHGVRCALASLGEFPADTTFSAVDQIDACTLFVIGSVLPRDPFNRTHYHLAIWDDDLRTCLDRGFIEGPSFDEGCIVFLSTKQMNVTLQGQYAILVGELTRDIKATLLEAVEDFLYLKRFDVAVREAALFVETALRQATGSTAFGQTLVEECFGAAGRMLSPELSNASRLMVRAAFRQFFKFVRNDFAHNFHEQDLVTTTRILRRCGHLVDLIEMTRLRSVG